jgi:hypothetical protein
MWGTCRATFGRLEYAGWACGIAHPATAYVTDGATGIVISALDLSSHAKPTAKQTGPRASRPPRLLVADRDGGLVWCSRRPVPAAHQEDAAPVAACPGNRISQRAGASRSLPRRQSRLCRRARVVAPCSVTSSSTTIPMRAGIHGGRLEAPSSVIPKGIAAMAAGARSHRPH